MDAVGAAAGRAPARTAVSDVLQLRHAVALPTGEELVKHPRLQVADERREVLRACCSPRAAGEQRVGGE